MMDASSMSEVDAAARADKLVLSFFYRRSDAPLNWYLWAEPGRPTIDQLVRQKQLAGVGVEAPTAAATGRTGPKAADKCYTIDRDQVVRMFRLSAARDVSTQIPWAQLESEVM